LAVTERPSVSSYEKPAIVDFGSLVELTASNALVELEDGIGKIINQDGSNGILP
jgi:hypothetical protein